MNKKHTYALEFPNGLSTQRIAATHFKTWIDGPTVLAEFYDGKEVVAAVSGFASVINVEVVPRWVVGE